MADFFDDLQESSNATQRKPFFAIDFENDANLLTWLRAEMSFIRQDGMDTQKIEKIRNNILRYKGVQYWDQVHQQRDLPDKKVRYMPQMVVPLIRDMIDEKTARIIEYKPSISVMPVHDEQRDKVDAKIAKRFLSHIDYVEDLDLKFADWVKKSKICGEAYLCPLWNPDKGDIHPEYKDKMTLDDGAMLNRTVYVGDIDVKVLIPYFDVLTQKVDDEKKVDYRFMIEWVYTEELKADYPSKASQINSDQKQDYYDLVQMEEINQVGMTMKVTFFHRKTKYMPQGYECVFTKDCVLKKGPLSYKHGMIPMITLKDGINPKERDGDSSINHVKAMASQYNNLTNMIIKQQMLAAHPKWFIEAGSLDEQQLGNDIGIVKIKNGAQKPVLAQGNPVSPQVFDFRQTLKNEFYEMSKSNSVVRGEPPPGVTAFVALQFVSEQENRRQNQDVGQYNAGVRQTYDMILKTCAQFYKKEDQRTMMILGSDNRWSSKSYDPSSIAKPYNIMLQNQSALPESKALRTQFILDMAERFPDLFPREQIIEMMNLGQTEKFMDEGAAAARAAESENEKMLDGDGLIEPAPHEFHMIHWKVHTMAMQDPGFKEQASPEVQQAMIDHITATEMLMFEQAQRSPQFAQMLSTLPQFPIYFEGFPMNPIPQINPMGVMPTEAPMAPMPADVAGMGLQEPVPQDMM